MRGRIILSLSILAAGALPASAQSYGGGPLIADRPLALSGSAAG